MWGRDRNKSKSLTPRTFASPPNAREDIQSRVAIKLAEVNSLSVFFALKPLMHEVDPDSCAKVTGPPVLRGGERQSIDEVPIYRKHCGHFSDAEVQRRPKKHAGAKERADVTPGRRAALTPDQVRRLHGHQSGTGGVLARYPRNMSTSAVSAVARVRNARAMPR
jgi:hypothetical protein